jgi:PKD repeat protein
VRNDRRKILIVLVLLASLGLIASKPVFATQFYPIGELGSLEEGSSTANPVGDSGQAAEQSDSSFGVHSATFSTPLLEPEFIAEPISGPEPLTVIFTDKSSGEITNWLWEFGDGGSSTDENPRYLYSEAGTYTVSLTVTSSVAFETVTKSDYIQVIDASPRAAFTGTPHTGQAPLHVTFADASLGNINSWYWNFGDGTGSNQKNPTHSYASPGTYTVGLTVTGPGGADSETKIGYITVTWGGGIEELEKRVTLLESQVKILEDQNAFLQERMNKLQDILINRSHTVQKENSKEKSNGKSYTEPPRPPTSR